MNSGVNTNGGVWVLNEKYRLKELIDRMKVNFLSYWVSHAFVILFKDPSIRCARDEDSCFLGVTTKTNIDSSGALLNVGHEVEKWDLYKGSTPKITAKTDQIS
jgi:hypothetical protein